MEIWHPCAGFETHYEVSNFGNVRSIERMVRHAKGGLKKSPSKVLKHGKSKSGYLIVSFCVDGVKSNQTVHRLVARAFLHNELNKPQVNHKDGNKHNNHLNNLEWVTAKENIHHAWRTGLCKAHTLGKNVICNKTGKIYKTVKEAAIELGYNHKSLCNMLNPKFNSHKNNTNLNYI